MKKRTKWLRLTLITLVLAVCLGVAGIGGFYFLVKGGAFGVLPDREELLHIRNARATQVLDRQGALIGKIFAVNRTESRYQDLPQHLVDALIATEDHRFWDHEGIDQMSLLRVVVKSILLGDESSGGGSTLTQQLAKNLYGRKNHGWLTLPVNKTKEMILAQRLETLYEKEQIVELYLNTVPFSEDVYGIVTASRRFFDCPPGDLQKEQAAVLIGMLKANTYYNPRINPGQARGRRNVVLQQMERHGYLAAAEADSLLELPLGLAYQSREEEALAPYFMVEVKREAQQLLEAHLPKDQQPDLERDGIRIITSLDAGLQAAAREALQQHLAHLQERFEREWRGRPAWEAHPEAFAAAFNRARKKFPRGLDGDTLKKFLTTARPMQVYAPGGDTVLEMTPRDSIAYYLRLLHAGFLALQPADGAVLAWVGGRDFRFLPNDHVESRRQAGSTFKPFVYATALEQGMDPCQYFDNRLRTYAEYEDWQPQNFDHEHGGFYSMAGALKKSVNLPAVQCLLEAGIPETQALARKLGLEGDMPDEPAMALGAGSVSLREIVPAFATWANGGYRVKPYAIVRILTAEGELLYERKAPDPERVIERSTAQLMAAMLQGVVREGTASRLSGYGVGSGWAGKTGTTQNYADGWFIGFNRQIVAGVWVGASDPRVHFRSGHNGSSSATALPVFGHFVRLAETGDEPSPQLQEGLSDLPAELQARLDCEDFREENLWDNVKSLFKKEPGQRSREEEKKKPGLWKRLFGGKDRDE